MKFKDFHPNVKLRIISMFISSMLSSMILPFMAIYFVSHFGAKIAGVLILINIIIGLIFNFIGGYVSDQYGRRKMLIFAETLKTSAIIITMLCNSPWFQSPEITFFAMTIYMISGGFSGPAHQAMLIDVSTPEQRTLMYTLVYWAYNLGVIIGGIGGGLFFIDHLFEMLAVLSIISLFSILLTFSFITESYFPTQKTAKEAHFSNLFKTYRVVLSDKLFVLFILAGVLIMSMEFHLTNFTSVRLSQEFNSQQLFIWELDGVNILGFLLAENTVVALLFSFVAVMIIKKLRDRKALLLGTASYVLGYAIIAYTNNIWLLLGLMVIASIGEIVYFPVKESLLASLPSEQARSSYMSINSASYNLAMGIASLTIIASGYLSKTSVVIAITTCGLIGVLTFQLIYRSISKRATEKTAAESPEVESM
ncbi:MFS transporter [Mechercharimyces sp. CAU 1602]|uniref:MFS transporter n=1 Tax=Mechercharimyces sp. CAU 1602 TaxID=2973933 RepID=UPI0021618683|nr:MFS transporter [Mechercharimyces sp. CAU 1602]MCS1352726.1 MFS transporter [Mechercharimyces sp. CAU 1602]